MKIGVALTSSAVLCLMAWAADNVAIAPRTIRNPAADAMAIPRMFSYQGRLSDTLGGPVSDSAYLITFRMYTVPSGGTAFWTETQRVTTTGGLFSVLLGSVNGVTAVPNNGEMYLGMQVGCDELEPRVRIVSAAYALKADTSRYALTAAPAGPAGGDLDGAFPNPTVTALQGRRVMLAAPEVGQVLKWTGSAWAPCDDGSATDNAWVRLNSDSVLYTINQVGIARGKADNRLCGDQSCTHANFGIACTTGTAGLDNTGCTVGGGFGNVAGGDYATVSGGHSNAADSSWATASGGYGNKSTRACATVGGGFENEAGGTCAVVAGGEGNTADATHAVIAGGLGNSAGGRYSTVAGGYRSVASGDYAVAAGLNNKAEGDGAVVAGGNQNVASGPGAFVGGGCADSATSSYAVVGGGFGNMAGGVDATVAGGHYNCADAYAAVGGGYENSARGYAATIAGGYQNTAAGPYSFAANHGSVVPGGCDHSAAFNGQTATASEQLRCGALSTPGGGFTIDHPLDHHGRILNHYFIEGPEMLNMYRGSVTLDASGRTEVALPDYFDALNRNPMVQLTGVGTKEVVYVAEDISGNRFTVGGPAGARVYWQVTGERRDVSAEAIRRMMPVEQPKTGKLAGRMLDDEFLSGCMEQLKREGKAQDIDFRTAAGRRRYERSLATEMRGSVSH